MTKPRICILKADGINCDEELFYAFAKYGGEPEYVHINQLRAKNKKLKAYQILALPGGFSYGDDIASGKILAVELISFFKDQLQEYINDGGLIIGICNGFQTLVRCGLLPFNHLGQMDATLSVNSSGHFECRFVKIKIENSRAKFLEPYVGQTLDIAVNHGEGRLFTNPKDLKKIESKKLIFCRYIDDKGKLTQKYPENPNGSIHAIAGAVDPTGHILGLMPHPEKIVEITQHPNWRRGNVEAKGGLIFECMIKFAKQS